MVEARRELVRAWLAKALHDLGTARKAAAETLTPYATLYRYPSDLQEPSREEFHEAMERAKNIFAFVVSKLPPEVNPEQPA